MDRAECHDPADNSKGTHAYPYESHVWAYDANDLVAVKNGQKQSWEVRPYATWKLDSSFVDVQGVGYDPATQRIYVSAACEDTNCLPLIKVYQINNVTGAPTVTAPTVTITANPVSVLSGVGSTLTWTFDQRNRVHGVRRMVRIKSNLRNSKHRNPLCSVNILTHLYRSRWLDDAVRNGCDHHAAGHSGTDCCNLCKSNHCCIRQFLDAVLEFHQCNLLHRFWRMVRIKSNIRNPKHGCAYDIIILFVVLHRPWRIRQPNRNSCCVINTFAAAARINHQHLKCFRTSVSDRCTDFESNNCAGRRHLQPHWHTISAPESLKRHNQRRIGQSRWSDNQRTRNG